MQRASMHTRLRVAARIKVTSSCGSGAAHETGETRRSESLSASDCSGGYATLEGVTTALSGGGEKALTLYDATREQIGEVLAGEPSYRIEQTWKGLYESFAEPENITTLSATLRKRLGEALPTALIPVRESVSDKGDTVKFLWHLADGNHPIETVLMHYADRATVC